ncbi:MAG: deoxyribonuclease IV, partial [candidate division NC10 bacterium]|nr:deoxyribonuclease IV [candidate division NC10 bacterium]
MSIAGGVAKALLRGQQTGCDTIQIFTKNNNQWRAKALTDQEVRTYHEHRGTTGIWPVVAHDGYLINPASPKRDLYRKSLEALRIEVGRAAALEIPCLIIHPGAHLGTGEAEGIQRVVEALDTILEDAKASSVTICLETTAGQGSSLGHRFEHLAAIREGMKQRDRVGICMDTCHIFAAGYEIRGRAGYEQTIDVLRHAKQHRPEVLTKTSLMLGLGERDTEVLEVLRDLLEAGVEVVTLGQYLQPTKGHLPVQRFVHPREFEAFRDRLSTDHIVDYLVAAEQV